ncbi:MAG TPA: hypothetical protein DCQ06_11265 [Myxococcales bacterium]|nr:hypothetical protein [Myxococcales bacterium]
MSALSANSVRIVAGACAILLSLIGTMVVAEGQQARKSKKSIKKLNAASVAAGIQRFYEKNAGFQADFTQVVKKRGIKRGIRRKGKVWLRKGKLGVASKKQSAKPGKMRWDYPKEEIFYFSDGVTLWSCERRESLAIKLPVKNSRLYQATSYLVGQGNLAKDFHMQVVRSPVKGTTALKLKPKAGTGVMRSLTLIVDTKSFAVKASVLVDPLGDSTSLFFSKTRYQQIDDAVFEWTPPAGVRVKTL